MKVRVDPEVCAGFGICIGIAPETFELTDDGYAIVKDTEVKPEDEDSIRRAAGQCPAQAIIISDDASS